MKLVIIGAGRLAVNLATALYGAGHDICQVYSRTADSAVLLSNAVGAQPTTSLSELCNDADAYIVALKDSVTESLVPKLCEGREERTFLLTSGSLSKNIFCGYARYYGVFYPMQTFSKERRVAFRNIPIFLDTSDERTSQFARQLALTIAERAIEMGEEDRRHLHVAAVFANNFANHSFAIAYDILAARNIDPSVLHALMDETVAKAKAMHPKDAQTGPAVRYDENVMERQKSLLCGENAKAIYGIMSKSIHELSQKEQ